MVTGGHAMVSAVTPLRRIGRHHRQCTGDIDLRRRLPVVLGTGTL